MFNQTFKNNNTLKHTSNSKKYKAIATFTFESLILFCFCCCCFQLNEVSCAYVNDLIKYIHREFHLKIIKKKPQPKPNHDPLLTLYCLCLIKLIFSQQNFDFVEMNCGVAKTKQLNLKSVVNENQVLALRSCLKS